MTKNPPIIDVACGSRMFWFDKNNPNVLFCDNRKLEDTLCDGRNLSINPDIKCDFTNLPQKDNSFRLVVFDPPHLINGGNNSWIVKKYGKLNGDWREVIRLGFSECFRVLMPLGVLIFKWNEDQIKLKDILALTPQQPLFGHKSGKHSKTHWLCFMKHQQ